MDGKIYVCEGEYQAETIEHEKAHLIWDKSISETQRNEYIKLYKDSLKY
jgi:hypothetical protein